MRRFLFFLFLMAGCGAYSQDLVAKTEHLSPVDEAKKFRLPPGFEAQLVAAEPDIHKPMNLAFDARGRLWVTDTVEYPFTAKAGQPTRDTLKILSDFDENGRSRKITTFADNLNIPIGVLPLGTGDRALVFSIPNIWRMTDTDNDGIADQREVALGSIGQRDTHGLTNGFTLGFDGWVYACHGYANDSTLKASDGSQIKINSGNTYRFRSDGSRVEQWTHGQVNPFGLSLDSFGNLFSADCHSKPIYMLLRGAFYPSFGKPDDGLGFAPEMCAHDHGSTGIAGICVYEADQFPATYRGTAFLGNVMTSRINHDRIEWRGSSPRAVEQPDFLVSDDPWFRPVDFELGPDGALYVADFYNRIIGHYEVDLKHPGRDRTSGRIWRIVYRGVDGKQPPPSPPKDLTKASITDLVENLADANLIVRMFATHQLVGRGAPAAKAVLAMLKNKSSPTQRAHALWILERLNALDNETLIVATKDDSALVRVHAFRVIGERSVIHTDTRVRQNPPIYDEKLRALAAAAQMDSDPTVRRVAADAIGTHPDAANVRPLLGQFHSVGADDLQLRHAIRMSLRNQLTTEKAFSDATLLVAERDAALLADLALAVPTAKSAAYLSAFLERHGASAQDWARFSRHIARYGDNEQPAAIGKLARAKFANSIVQQREIIKALQQGLQERGAPASQAIVDWATDIISQSISVIQAQATSWSHTAHPDRPAAAASPWGMQVRRCADGQDARVLSSFPKGETLTGVLRSTSFPAPAQFSFYICGHNGYPAQPDHGKNRIRLRESATQSVLSEATPPRNDTAQKVTWDLRAHNGKQVYLEIVDGDDAPAYAWLAVGRFDPPVVPLLDSDKGQRDEQLAAVEMIGSMRLTKLEPQLVRLFDSQDDELIAASANALAVLNTDNARAALAGAFLIASDRQQRSLALALSSTKQGATVLLDVIQEGKASARLLQDQVINERLAASKPANLKRRIETLTKDLPAADATLAKALDQRRTGFATVKPDAVGGAAVFEKHCAGCHSIGGKGQKFAPQLDGIGIRGAERLMEDILDPNRNVDAAFRTSILKLKDGRVLSGLVLREEGETAVMLNDERQEERVPKGNIELQQQSQLSPMPANFYEQLSESDFFRLVTYLLQQKAQ